ncbi:MAG: hypothetical protein ACOC1K_02920, partial [Nanoarchaeota archaeon]
MNKNLKNNNLNEVKKESKDVKKLDDYLYDLMVFEYGVDVKYAKRAIAKISRELPLNENRDSKFTLANKYAYGNPSLANHLFEVFLSFKRKESDLALLESAQIGDTVMFDKKKGYVIGQTGDGDLLIQIQGSTSKAKPKDVKVLGAKAKEMKLPFKFDKKTQKLLFEQWVRCGIFMETIPVKTSNCYVKYSDWKVAKDDDSIGVIVEGNNILTPKNHVRIFENVNDFANLENYVEGVEIDEATGDAISNV